MQALEQADLVRRTVAAQTERAHKSALGQFMTPASTARFMASLFPHSYLSHCHLLDAGAGVGALSCAFLDRWVAGDSNLSQVEATAYELDPRLLPYLQQHLSRYPQIHAQVIGEDYIQQATAQGIAQRRYTHAILNPPYKKIGSRSNQRLALRRLGIETVNLYSAFVALAVAQLLPGGQLVAILPRSFCNGLYYRPFRDFILQRAAIRHLHLFSSRNSAFKEDEVLQENLIIRLERDGQPGPVQITTSTDHRFHDLSHHQCAWEQIVRPGDPESVIQIPSSTQACALENSPRIRHSLADLGLQVSTGPVVDFRLKAQLRANPDSDTVPLLYPCHFSQGRTQWPLIGGKKPNAIALNTETKKWLYPTGHYCVVRRFSAKEERRRLLASWVDPCLLEPAPLLGFENHLNLIHQNRQPLPEALARGLAIFLNTTLVDDCFRRFSGHTQVNASDLKRIPYPSRTHLTALGHWAMQQHEPPTQAQLDAQLHNLLEGHED